MNQPTLYLCYSINDLAVMEAGISMLSFLMNNPGYEPEEIFFIDYGINSAHKEILNDIAAQYGRRITYLQGRPVTDVIKRQFPNLRSWSGTMAPNAKPFLDQIMPEYVERVLFLDADTLVMASIEELQHLDMRGAALAAVPQNMTSARVRSGSIRLYSGSNFYFNSGVLLIDLAVWRREDCHSMVIDILHKKKQLYTPDQTLLNNAIPARLQYQLPLKYNHLTHHIHPRQERYYLNIGHIHTAEEIEEAIRHPVIMHCTSGDHQARPWHEGCWSYRKEEYLRYKALSPWKDVPLKPDYRKMQQRKDFVHKGNKLMNWLASRQPSYRLSSLYMSLFWAMVRWERKIMKRPPELGEGIESLTPDPSPNE